MSRLSGRPLRRVLAAAALCLLLLAGAGVAYWQYGGWADGGGVVDRGPVAESPPSPPMRGAGSGEGSSETDLGATIEAGTILVFERRWQECEEVQTRSLPAGERLAGASLERLAEAFPGWRVEGMEGDRVLLVQSLPGDCPGPQAAFTLTIRDGKVVVLRGEGLDGPLYMETEVRADELLPGDRALLERGVTVVGEDRVWQYLEGMRDHAAEP